MFMNFVEQVKYDWSASPLAVIDSAIYVVIALACVKYLRRG